MDGTTAALASDEIQAVLSHLAHEFERPLRAFRSALDRVTSGMPTAEGGGRDHAETMTFVCDDLLLLMESYTEYLRLSGLDPEPRNQPIRLGTLLAEIDRQCRPKDGARSWTCRLDGPDVEVRADPALCLLVMARLVDNALRYGKDRVAITVSAGHRKEAWALVVADDGPGIPESDREHVLEPFARLPRDVNAAIPGAGLGLTLCRCLVARMGGTIAIDAPPEEGTRVTIEFPSAGKPGPAQPKNPQIDPIARDPRRC